MTSPFSTQTRLLHSMDKGTHPMVYRMSQLKLYNVEPPLTTTITQQENSFLRLYKTKLELDSYLHAAAGFPKKSISFRQSIMEYLLHGLALLQNSYPNT